MLINFNYLSCDNWPISHYFFQVRLQFFGYLTSHGLGLLKLFVLCDGQISWSETIAFLLDLDRNASPSAEISIWHGLVLYRVSLKGVKLSKIIFYCRINFFYPKKKLHLQNLAKHSIFHIVNCVFSFMELNV